MSKMMWRLSCLILFSCIDLSLNAYIQRPAGGINALTQTPTFVTEIIHTLEFCQVPEVNNIWHSSLVERFCDLKIPFKFNVSELEFDFEHELFLCTALYEYSQTVCTESKSNNLSGFSLPVIPVASKFCQNSSKTLSHNSAVVNQPEAKPFMESYSKNIGNETQCGRVCVTDKIINPLCESIYKLNWIVQYYRNASQKGIDASSVSGNSSSAHEVKELVNSPHASATNRTSQASGLAENSPEVPALPAEPKSLGSSASVHHGESETKKETSSHNSGQLQTNSLPETDTHKSDSSFNQNLHRTESQGQVNSIGPNPEGKEILIGNRRKPVGDVSDGETPSGVGNRPLENSEHIGLEGVNDVKPLQSVSANQGEGNVHGIVQSPSEPILPNDNTGQVVDKGHKSKVPPKSKATISKIENVEDDVVGAVNNDPIAVQTSDHSDNGRDDAQLGKGNSPSKPVLAGDRTGFVWGNVHGAVNNQSVSTSNANQVGSSGPGALDPSHESSAASNKPERGEGSAQRVNNSPKLEPENGNAAPNTDPKTSNLPTDPQTSLSSPLLVQVPDTEKDSTLGELPKPVKPENKPEVSAGVLPIEDETQQQDSLETEITAEQKNPGPDKDGLDMVEEYSQEDNDDENDPTRNLGPANGDPTHLDSVAHQDPATHLNLHSNLVHEVDLNANAAGVEYIKTEDSHFFAYFTTMIVLCVVGYLIFHNKQKIMALALEGRSRRNTRRRPNTAGYRKLDSNLEEAVTSTCSSSSVTHVIY